MKTIFRSTIAAAAVLSLIATVSTVGAASPKKMARITVTSDAFEDGGIIPDKHAIPENISPALQWKVDKKIAKKIKSYAILMIDRHPDANEWIHLAATGIPPKTRSLEEGALNACPPDVADFFISNGQNPVNSSNAEELKTAVQKVKELFAKCSLIIKKGKKTIAEAGLNRYGFMGYGGPNPPSDSGEHLYEIIVYGLSVKKFQILSQDVRNGSAALEARLEAKSLAKGSLTGFFERVSEETAEDEEGDGTDEPSASSSGSSGGDDEAASAPQEWTVEINGSRYTPATLAIKAGDKVTFVNKEDEVHWPASAVHPTHTVYPETGGCIGSAFDACKALKKGEAWSFTFTHKGAWKYHDHLTGPGGTITVE